ncbi:MAG: hypothetical protein RBS43_06795, partial [Candidatus Cloacimonas sp.]|nr:hypothetical protein [Candidatus Cloacimonas sp.]
MKRSVLFVLLWLALVLLCAQESVLLRSSQHLAFDGVTVQLPNATTLVFWNDTSSGTSDIYAQKLGSEGNSLWATARPIVSQPLDQRIIEAVYTSDASVILLYMDFPVGEYGSTLRLQKISLAGQPLWNAEGVHIADTEYPSTKDQIALVPNNVGGAFVTIYQSGLIAFNYNASGINQWPLSELFALSNFKELQALSDGDGGLMINCSSYNYTDKNRVVHLDAAGDTVGNFDFSLPGLPVPNQFKMLRNTTGQYILYTALDTAVGIQIMDINGNLLQPEILTIPYALSNVYPNQFKMIPVADGGLFYSYLGHADYNASIALHRLNSNLQPLWATPVVYPDLGNCNSFDLAINATNSAWLTWTNGYPEYNVSAVRINADGTNAFSPMQIGIINQYSDKLVILVQADEASIVWNDLRGERNGLSIQVLTNSGAPQLASGGREVYSVLNGSTELSACKSLNNKFIFVYRDSRFNWRDKIYYQITNNDLVPLLEANGNPLNPDPSNGEQYLDCVAKTNNRLLLLYAVYQGNMPEIYLQEVDENGNRTWPGKGLLVTNTPSIDINRCQISLVNDDVLVTWNTYSSSSKIGRAH